MKGVVLAGGTGTRLRPMTRVVNKHLLPIYDEPLIYYPVKTLVDSGIDEILLISGADYLGKYAQLLEESEIEATFSYKVQPEPKGIAHAVGLAEKFVDDTFAVILGDNIITGDISSSLSEFEKSSAEAQIFVTEVEKPSAYGVATISDDRVTNIEEKPTDPNTNNAVIGLYTYTRDIFSKIDNLEPSDRGEYEITDVNHRYVLEGNLAFKRYTGEWFDAGTPEGLFMASQSIREERQQISDKVE